MVGGRVDAAVPEGGAPLAHLRGLGERADGGGGEGGKPEALLLGLAAHRKRARSRQPDVGCRPERYRRLVDARRLPMRQCRGGAGFEDGSGGRAPLLHGERQRRDFRQLLRRKGQPRLELGIEVGFGIEVDGAVQQRARRCDFQPVRADAVPGGADQGQLPVEIGAPDVAAVDHPDREQLVGRQRLQHRRQLLGSADEVDMKAGHMQPGRQVEIVAERAEIAGEHDARRHRLQQIVAAAEGGALRRGEVERQDRLVDLHPLGAGRLERRQQLGIDRQHAVEQRQRIERCYLRFAEAQPGDRADQHRSGLDAEAPCLEEFVDHLAGGKPEALAGLQLRDDVVVVGVEPLGHFHRRRRLGAARHGEVERRRVGDAGEAGRGGPQRRRHVQHVVVEREIVGGDHVDAGCTLQLPVAGAQLPAGGIECRSVDGALPVRLERMLQFAMEADAGKAEIGGTGHGVVRCVSRPGAGVARAGEAERGEGGAAALRESQWLPLARTRHVAPDQRRIRKR